MNNRLLQAVDLIEQVIAELNTKSNLCDSCGLYKHEERDEWQADTELRAVIKKLKKWSSHPLLRKRGKT